MSAGRGISGGCGSRTPSEIQAAPRRYSAWAGRRVYLVPGDPVSQPWDGFIEAAISQRNEPVLPLHGGPPLTVPATRAIQQQVHQVIQEVINHGRADGTIRQDVTPHDIAAFGAMLAQPREPTRPATPSAAACSPPT